MGYKVKNIEESEPNVHVVELDGRIFYILGTAHISAKSANMVKRIIHLVRPDTVCVELCSSRLSSLKNPARWQDTNIFKIIKEGKAYVLMAQLALASYQKRLANELDIRPGEEMYTAIKMAEEVDAQLVPVDRAIKITLKRAWRSSSLWSLIKIFSSLIASMFSREKLEEKDIEKLKENDALTAVMSELSGHLPEAKVALVDERDKYLSKKIESSKGDRIVAVVGAGHVPGILEHIGNPVDIEELEKIPKPRMFFKFLTWFIPLIVIAIIAYGFNSLGLETFKDMAIIWWLANGISSALGALIALAHPLTILTAFLVAPITSLNPTIAAGWVCGLVEALVNKPRVSDLENIGEEISTLKGVWTNRVTRILLVMALANIGSVIGTFLGLGKIIPLIF